MTNGAATKNGHAIPTENGLAFEDGRPVNMATFPFDEADREFAEQQREIGRREVMMDLMAIMRMGFDFVFESANPKMAVETYRYAAGQIDVTEQQIAERHGVTKQAVSKQAKRWQKLLRLPPSSAMRSDKACETFKRKTTETWKQRKQAVEQAEMSRGMAN